jgi:hypothetical protein
VKTTSSLHYPLSGLRHPCDETAVAVLLGVPKLSPPPCFLARKISAATDP